MMKKSEITNKITHKLNKAGFALKKHSPEILIVSGVIGTIASAVIACKSTMKVSGILNDTKEQLDTIHSCIENPDNEKKYTCQDAKKDTTIVYIHTGIQFVKLYAPAVALGVLSIGSIVASNDILRKRNAALAAAYATVDRSFKEYRKRVADRFGDEIEYQLRNNIKAVQIEEKITDENGEEKTVTKTINVIDTDNTHNYSEYSVLYDEKSSHWEKDSDYNQMFLRAQQSYANDKLRAKGYLFLNEVYAMLGLPLTKAGQVVGWIYNSDNPNGDNYVDFGIHDTYSEAANDFINGYERSILLDFNVDGNIFDLMPNGEL